MHHRLIDAGFSQKKAVITLYCISMVTAVMAIVIAMRDPRAIFVMVIFLLALLMVLYVYRKRTNVANETDKANKAKEL
jgi:UDP-GlcNAc:undecaprenyl-phosphate GlcNAc-1-phosphate transferase